MLRKTGTMTSDGNDSDSDRNVIGAAGVLAGSAQHEYGGENPYRLDGVRGSYDGERHAALAQEQPLQQSADRAMNAPTNAQPVGGFVQQQQQQPVAYQQQPVQQQPQAKTVQQQAAPIQPQAVPTQQQAIPAQQAPIIQNGSQGDWMVPAAGGVAAGAGAGILGTEAYKRHQRDATVPETEGDASPVSPINANDPVVAAAAVPTDIPRATDTSASAYAAVPVNPTASEELAEAGETRRGSPGVIALNDTATPVTALPSKPSFGDRNNIDDILSAASTPPATADALATPTAITSDPLASATTTTAVRSGSTDEHLGGNERVGAHETGELFPRVIRHDTSLSVSALHVPGEFPAR